MIKQRIGIIALALMCVAACTHAAEDKVVAGYFANWAMYREHCQKYEQYDPTGYTHAILAFASITETFDAQPFDPWGDIEQGGYEKFVAAKKTHPNLKTMVAFGGWTFSNDAPTCYIFPNLAKSAENRAHFTQSAIDYCRKYGFDGVDLDWEYPGMTVGGSQADFQNYVELVKDMMTAFEAEAAKTGKDRLLLTVAVPVPYGYQIKYKDMSQYIDWFNLMTYDFAGTWSGRTLPHTPLRALKEGSHAETHLGIMEQVDDLLALGVAKDKIAVGLGFYGHSWKLSDTSNTGFYSPSWIGGATSKCTYGFGTIAWFEIEEWRKETGVVTKYDDWTATVYSYKDNYWVGYDDAITIKIKCEYIVEKGLRGAMCWTMDFDDEQRALSKAMYETIHGSVPPSTKCPSVSSSTVANTKDFSCANYAAGATCTYSCKDTYVVSGTSATTRSMKCLESGVWSPAPAGCVAGAAETYTWKVGAFSPCTGECGKGTQTRPVTCVDSSGNTVDDSKCSGTKPWETQACTLTTSKCGANTECVNNKCVCKTGYTGNPLTGCTAGTTGYTWKVGAFSPCTGECGKGTQTRPVTCIDSSGNTVDDSKCSGTKPWETQACTLTTSKCGANTECVNNKCVCKTGYTGDPLSGCIRGGTGKKCFTHCDCVTWDVPDDLDPICLNGECVPLEQVLAR